VRARRRLRVAHLAPARPLDAAEHRFFVAAERISLASQSDRAEGRRHRDANGKARFNPDPVARQPRQDLPSWLALDSTRVRCSTIGLPDYETRCEAREASRQPVSGLRAGHRGGAREGSLRDFAQRPTGCARRDERHRAARGIVAASASRVDDAVQCFKVGVAENPWKKDYLRDRIANALPLIEERVARPAGRGDQDNPTS
jgi:hypothetical protein